MRKGNYILLSALIIVIIAFFTYTEAGAVADGNGSCSAVERSANDCGHFGTSVIEYLGTQNTQCGPTTSPIPCTVYFYRYSGTATNQINILLPKSVTKTMNVAAYMGCSQFYISTQSNPGGDPTTGFGKNLLTFDVCRIANNLSGLPPIIPPTNATFFLAVDRSGPGPLSWQVRQSANQVFGDAVQGPALAPNPFSAVSVAQTQLVAGGQCLAHLTYDALGNVIDVETEPPCTVSTDPVFVNGDPLRDNRSPQGITHGNGTCTTYGPPIPSPSRSICR